MKAIKSPFNLFSDCLRPRGRWSGRHAESYADECDLDNQVSDDCNGNRLPDECDVALADCNGNEVPDDCDADFDGDATPDDCDPDIDGDGVANAGDVCPETPSDAAVNPSAGPMGDIDADCLFTLADYAFFEICLHLSGPGRQPGFQDYLDVFDFDNDEDVDPGDFAGMQAVFDRPSR